MGRPKGKTGKRDGEARKAYLAEQAELLRAGKYRPDLDALARALVDKCPDLFPVRGKDTSASPDGEKK